MDNKAVIAEKHDIYVIIFIISSRLLLFSSCIQVFILKAHPVGINSHIETHHEDAYKSSKVARCLQTATVLSFEASHLGSTRVWWFSITVQNQLIVGVPARQRET